MTYALLMLGFVLAAGLSVARISRARRWWDMAGAASLMLAVWVVMVLERPMTPSTASVAFMGADLAILAIGIAGTIRMLSMDSADADSGFDGRFDDEDVDPPDEPSLSEELRVDWDVFPWVLDAWEQGQSVSPGRQRRSRLR